ncbi:MAG: hypothetical protein ACYCOU_05925 [Sulfobacillus sp.]
MSSTCAQVKSDTHSRTSSESGERYFAFAESWAKEFLDTLDEHRRQFYRDFYRGITCLIFESNGCLAWFREIQARKYIDSLPPAERVKMGEKPDLQKIRDSAACISWLREVSQDPRLSFYIP